MLDDAELIRADRQAREIALDVKRSFIVQAPAGSGKTELLIQRFLALLAVVKEPEQILAITFTNKAAREMQLRVINALRRADEGVVAASKHEELTTALARQALARDGEYGWRLIDSPGRLHIQTVDAFSAGVARAMPLSSGLGGVAATLADAGMSAIYRDAAAATLDYLANKSVVATAVERVLAHLDNHISVYISYLVRMLASRDQWLPITGGGIRSADDATTMRQYLEGNLRRIVEGQLAAVQKRLPQEFQPTMVELLRYAASNLHSEVDEAHPLSTFADCQRLPQCDESERVRWQAIANLLLVKDGGWRKRITKKDGFPTGDDGQKQQLYDLIESLQSRQSLRASLDRVRHLPAARYSDEQWSVLLALFDLLPIAAGELSRLFSERGVTDHIEVSIAAGRALGKPDNPGDMALVLDYKLQHLLVDEMQDTSIGQYELLKRLTAGWERGDGRSVFCVGDPMQSIYRFRNAEVGEFVRARETGIGDVDLEPLLLRRNFRSGENLVHWFNTVFSQVMPTQDDLTVGAISYAESAAVPEQTDLGRYTLHPLFDATAEGEAARTVSIVKECLEAVGDIAILVRSRTQLAELLPALRQSGVEFQAVEIDRLTDLPEIIDVLALTRALVHCGDRLAWLALLRGPWVGLNWKDLHALVRNDVQQTIPELATQADRVAKLSATGAARMRSFMGNVQPYLLRHGTWSLRDRVELAWFALGGPAILSDPSQLHNVYRYFAVLETMEVAGSLEDVSQLERRLDDERVSSKVSSDCRVQIMTMHKAKGLQFDHVILPSLGRSPRSDSSELFSWLNVPGKTGAHDMLISPVGPRSVIDRDPLHQFIKSSAMARGEMELDRLLYVACTRAIKSLHLVGSVSIAPDGKSFRPPPKRSLLRRLWPAIENQFEEEFDVLADNNTVYEGIVGSAHLVAPLLRRFHEQWSAPVFSSRVAEDQNCQEPLTADEKEVEYSWVGTSARIAGTVVHRLLKQISDGAIRVNVDRVDELEINARRVATDLGANPDQVHEVWERTRVAIKEILSDPKGQWLLNGEGEAEFALSGFIGGRIESIVIDRVKIDDQGVHWVVDYKTSTHEGGDLQGFLRQESDRYRPQLQKYAEIYAAFSGEQVKTALYFPLLREFCEVPIEPRL